VPNHHCSDFGCITCRRSSTALKQLHCVFCNGSWNLYDAEDVSAQDVTDTLRLAFLRFYESLLGAYSFDVLECIESFALAPDVVAADALIKKATSVRSRLCLIILALGI